MTSADTLQKLLGPSVEVVADPDNENTYFCLSSGGEFFVYLSGMRREVPEVLKETLKAKHFPEPAEKPAPRKLTLADLPYETQERYNSALDILAGVKAGATREDRRRAKSYVAIVLDSIKNSDVADRTSA